MKRAVWTRALRWRSMTWISACACGRWATGVLFTPYAELYHYESKSRGLDTKGPARERFEGERRRMKQRYGERLLRDPFYNPNLTLDREDFSESDALPKDDPVPGVPARG